MSDDHRQSHQAGWTQPRVDRMRKLWLEGKSAAAIARDLGGGLTRNGVIGKVHREGLSERKGAGGAKPINPRASARPAPRPAPSAPRPVSREAAPAAVRADPTPLPPEPVIEGTVEPVTLMQLGAHACKWPIGFPDPVQLFCGRRQHAKTPYCRDHAKVAYSSASSLSKHTPSELARSLRRYL